MFRFVPTLILAAASTTSLGAFVLQDTGRPQDKDAPGKQQEVPGSTSQGRGARVEGEKGAVLATWLIVHNKMEVELSKMAEQKSQNPEVKAFAQKMVADHGAFLTKLQTFAGAAAASGAGRPAEAGATRPTGVGTMDFDHVALIQELGNQFLQTSRTELDKKQGEDFDRCYMGMAVAAHLKANDMLTVFQKHASGELASAFQEGQRTVQTHLTEARAIAEKLDK